VSLHEGRDGGFVPLLEEVLQELAVGQTSPILLGGGPTQLLDDRTQLACRHLGRLSLLELVVRARSGL
jgi:hypothetical protein